MVQVAKEMKRRDFHVPLLIGGATTSARHTAVRIAPHYDEPVVHVKDASLSVPVVEKLIDADRRDSFAVENREQQARDRSNYADRQARKLVTYAEALARRFQTDWHSVDIPTPSFLGLRTIEDQPLKELRPYIDWSPFFMTWELKGKFPTIFEDPSVGEEARKLYNDANKLLDRIIAEKLLVAKGVYGFWPATSKGDDIVIHPLARHEHGTVKHGFLAERIADALRERSLRLTKEHQRIVEAVATLRSTFTLEDLVSTLLTAPEGGRVRRSTIYRTLALMHDAGLIHSQGANGDETFVVNEHVHQSPSALDSQPLALLPMLRQQWEREGQKDFRS
ncbi:MAG: vitamin B12 dependent-methionine synthase activation domain-containing protein, partial [Pirellulales bacterium]